jgi:hypothetical protein
MPALKLVYAFKDCNFSFTYEITVDVRFVAKKTHVSTTKVKVAVGGSNFFYFLCYKYMEGGGCVHSETSLFMKTL